MPTNHTIPTATERARFEAWAEPKFHRLEPAWRHTMIELMREAWMARAALAAQEGGGERVTEATQHLERLLKQADIADQYAQGEKAKNDGFQSVWEIMNGHIRDYARSALNALHAAQEDTGNVPG